MSDSRNQEVFKNLMPGFIELETSTYCNRRCSWCPNSKYKRSQLRNFISFNLFMKIINDLKEINYDGQLALHNYNEPLLDPNLYKYLGIIKTKLPKAKVVLFTNGDYFEKIVLKKLEKNGVFSICISLHDAIGKDNYKEVLFNNLKKIGKEDYRLKDVSDVFGRKYKIDSSGMQIIYYVPNPKMMTSRGGIIKNLEKSNKNIFCFLPFSSSAIDYRGNMKICCEVYPENNLHKKIGLIGNLKKKSFSDLWFSNKYNLLRKSFLSNNIKNRLCLKCLRNNNNIHHKKISEWKKFLKTKLLKHDQKHTN
jgi:MoaA/NifB/PqqE/SkfB family radical SAM enzyme